MICLQQSLSSNKDQDYCIWYEMMKSMEPVGMASLKDFAEVLAPPPPPPLFPHQQLVGWVGLWILLIT